MKTLDQFYKLKNTEDYFEFFGVDYDKHIIEVKRFHIMKEYGTLIKKGFAHLSGNDEQLMDFFKFALIKVYIDYKNGHTPSAAEVWGMLEDGKAKGCLACALSAEGGNCAC